MPEIRGQVGGFKHPVDAAPIRRERVRMRPWEPWEDHVVEAGSHTIEFLSDRLNRDPVDVVARMKRLGIDPAERTMEHARAHAPKFRDSYWKRSNHGR